MQWNHGRKIEMNDDYILEHGYKPYDPIQFDNYNVVKRFQKRFDDDFGKKYFIDILKWSNDYVPKGRRDSWWTPFTYTYEVQVTMHEEENALNLEFFSGWTLENVENFMKDFFEKMKPNYYESWNEERGVRP